MEYLIKAVPVDKSTPTLFYDGSGWCEDPDIYAIYPDFESVTTACYSAYLSLNNEGRYTSNSYKIRASGLLKKKE